MGNTDAMHVSPLLVRTGLEYRPFQFISGRALFFLETERHDDEVRIGVQVTFGGDYCKPGLVHCFHEGANICVTGAAFLFPPLIIISKRLLIIVLALLLLGHSLSKPASHLSDKHPPPVFHHSPCFDNAVAVVGPHKTQTKHCDIKALVFQGYIGYRTLHTVTRSVVVSSGHTKFKMYNMNTHLPTTSTTHRNNRII